MELDGEDILLFDDGSKIRAVVGESYGLAVEVGGSEGVREVKIRFSRDAFEKTGGASELELVPSHVRELDGGGKGTNRTGQEIEAREFGGLLAGFVKRLQAETDAEKGNATVEGIQKGRAESALIECADERSVMPDAG